MKILRSNDLTISEKIIIDDISEKENFSDYELGFIFTTIRDNCTKDEHTKAYLELLIDLISQKNGGLI